MKVKNLYSTLWYPQSNDHMESSNKTLLTTLKKRLHFAKGKWVEEPPGVLWAYKTIGRKPTGMSIFALTYEMEDIISIEIGMPTLQTEILEEANNEAVTKDLDMTDELCEAAIMRIASYQQRLTNLYNKRVKPRTFQDEDLVLRRVFENTTNLIDGEVPTKLGKAIYDSLSGSSRIIRVE